ncbi:YbfB/YjiJ family MFS transporter [Aquabacterium sp.]|uniref:YbfB/YjiJ family MFS transporter n=1 Tax=Aquabacterium sp. TaxID=1872578 RepID=UPI003784900F
MVDSRAAVLRQALALALAAAVSLGLARFAYALLLPPMRADLGWRYFTAGAMNTVNAAGYLLGALLMPRWLARHDARRLMLAGGAGAALGLAAHALLRDDAALLALRFALGVASAASFVGGGVLAARLAALPAAAGRSGLVLGIYYGGTGLGIVLSALLVPAVLAAGAARWPAAWLALALAAAACTALTALWGVSVVVPAAAGAAGAPGGSLPWRWPALARALGWGLAGYCLFGLGYIGYMTFIVTLLREQGLGGGAITAFYALLGAGVIASSWLWAGLLQRFRGGGPMALLNALLALATVLPVLSAQPLLVFASGALFGAVFLSVVASTTALVRHNLPPAAWSLGISAFTIVFAAGQIVGPSLVGRVADGAGGLARGLAISAAALLLGSLLAWLQRPLRS